MTNFFLLIIHFYYMLWALRRMFELKYLYPLSSIEMPLCTHVHMCVCIYVYILLHNSLDGVSFNEY